MSPSSFSSANQAQFRNPQDLSVNRLGQIFVADTGNDRVQWFGPNGRYGGEFGGFGLGDRQFHHPGGIDARTSLDIWVADTFNRRAVHLDRALNVIAAVGDIVDHGDELPLGEPTDVALSKSGTLYVVDRENDRLLEFTPFDLNGRELVGFGSGTASLGDPAAVAVGKNGSIYVADSRNNRIAIFDQFGAYVGQIRGFSGPEGVNVTRRGHVIVADTGNHRVVACARSGRFLGVFGSEGSGLGGLKSPTAAALDPRDRLIVLDSGNNRVQIWRTAGSAGL